jgi:Tol biopolymer transport system component/transcriptional regulator with XRE-family HTH domain
VSDDLSGPAWSPIGDRILFGAGGFFQRAQVRTARLMSIRPDGTDLVSVTSGNSNDAMPSWSPDGKQVVFRAALGTTRALYILDTTSGTRRKLETGSDYDTFPSWSPRGDWISVTSKRDGNYEIYRIRPDGSGLQRLTHFSGVDAHSSFSPGGEWIAFATGLHGRVAFLPGLRVTLRAPKPKLVLENPETIGEHLRARRIALGLYQRQAAEMLGVNLYTVINWEKGRTQPPTTAYAAILAFLGYDPRRMPETLGERLRARRGALGLSIRKAAATLGADPTAYGNWERGASFFTASTESGLQRSWRPILGKLRT